MSDLKLNLKNARKEVDKTIKSLLPIGKGIEKKLFEDFYPNHYPYQKVEGIKSI